MAVESNGGSSPPLSMTPFSVNSPSARSSNLPTSRNFPPHIYKNSRHNDNHLQRSKRRPGSVAASTSTNSNADNSRSLAAPSPKVETSTMTGSHNNVKKIQYIKRKVSSTYNTFKNSMKLGNSNGITSSSSGNTRFETSANDSKVRTYKRSSWHARGNDPCGGSAAADDFMITNSKRYLNEHNGKRKGFSRGSNHSVLVIDNSSIHSTEIPASAGNNRRRHGDNSNCFEDDEMRLLNREVLQRFPNHLPSLESSLNSHLYDGQQGAVLNDKKKRHSGRQTDRVVSAPSMDNFDAINSSTLTNLFDNYRLGSLRSSSLADFSNYKRQSQPNSAELELYENYIHNNRKSLIEEADSFELSNHIALVTDNDLDGDHRYISNYLSDSICGNAVTGDLSDINTSGPYTSNNLRYSTLLNNDNSTSTSANYIHSNSPTQHSISSSPRNYVSEVRPAVDHNNGNTNNGQYVYDASASFENLGTAEMQHTYSSGDQINGEFTAISRESIEQIIQHIFSIPNRSGSGSHGDGDNNGQVSSIYFEMTIDIFDLEEDDTAYSQGF